MKPWYVLAASLALSISLCTSAHVAAQHSSDPPPTGNGADTHSRSGPGIPDPCLDPARRPDTLDLHGKPCPRVAGETLNELPRGRLNPERQLDRSGEREPARAPGVTNPRGSGADSPRGESSTGTTGTLGTR